MYLQEQSTSETFMGKNLDNSRTFLEKTTICDFKL